MSAVLLESGIVSRSDLLAAEQHAARERTELTDALATLGLTSERDANDAAAAAAGTERIDLEELASSELAVRLVPEKLARRLLVVPIHVSDRTLTYATCRPFARDTDQDLPFASGRRTHMVVATRTAVMAALDHSYPRRTATGGVPCRPCLYTNSPAVRRSPRWRSPCWPRSPRSQPHLLHPCCDSTG